MCINSNLSIKDFLPLAGTLITIITGYAFITIQINKNRRVTWLNEFRKEVAHTLTLLGNLVGNQNLEGEIVYPSERRIKIWSNLLLSYSIIELYLNLENEKHQNFLKNLNNTIELISNREPNSNDQFEIEETIKLLTKSAKDLITGEIKGIEKMSII